MKKEFFPQATLIEWENGVRQYSTSRGDTEILISYIPPKTIVKAHGHHQAQIGMILKGELYMEVGGESRVMTPLESIYVSPPNILHGGENKTDEEVIAIDIKRFKKGEDYSLENRFFKTIHKEEKLMNVMDVQFFHANWAEIMLVDIPCNGGMMPKHRHKHEQIGICIGGEYDMTIEDVNTTMKFGKSYFCLENEFHSAINNRNENSKLINIFIPPRYNKEETE
ncbi:cupin domain-containing protein [Dickeya poaceiphila]|uniref:Cupin domain-containing protein n=1 Tax=Dickeya poaceiphila TaxID=568768 RepID=A0A5B8I8D2_9GAMM|nr:cupin domain-containing protein [Dickeya poaceiphila]QDX29317.1 cupin domain-containing protein [Dickeya poaceiphila]